jgi:hypothetical protein
MAMNPSTTLNIAGRLVVNGRSIALGQVCRDSLVLAEPCNLPPTAARLIITVRGEEKVYDIFLPHGVSRNNEAVKFF